MEWYHVLVTLFVAQIPFTSGLSALAEFLVLMMYLSCMRREIRAYPSVKSRLGGVFCGVYFLGKCGTNFWSIA